MKILKHPNIKDLIGMDVTVILDDALRKRGFNLFADMLSYDNYAKSSISTGAVLSIIALTDAAVNAIMPAGSNLREVMSTDYGKSILRNHLILGQDVTTNTWFTLNGQIQDILGKIVKAGIPAFRVGNIFVGNSNKAILTEFQIAPIVPPKKPGVGKHLGYHNFINLVIRGSFKGLDLISFCLSSADTNNYCNKIDDTGRTIFHRVLDRDFDIRADPGDDARALYAKLSRGYKFYCFTRRDDEEPAPTIPKEHIKLIGERDGPVKYIEMAGRYPRQRIFMDSSTNNTNKTNYMTFVLVDTNGELVVFERISPGFLDPSLFHWHKNKPKFVTLTKLDIKQPPSKIKATSNTNSYGQDVYIICEDDTVYEVVFYGAYGIRKPVPDYIPIFHDPEITLKSRSIYSKTVKARRKADNSLVVIFDIDNPENMLVMPEYMDAKVNKKDILFYNKNTGDAYIMIISNRHEIPVGNLGLGLNVEYVDYNFFRYPLDAASYAHRDPVTGAINMRQVSEDEEYGWMIVILDTLDPNGHLFARNYLNDWVKLAEGVTYFETNYDFFYPLDDVKEQCEHILHIVQNGVYKPFGNKYAEIDDFMDAKGLTFLPNFYTIAFDE